MREAIRQARRGLGLTSPNPPVGCVIARRGQIIARGYHRKAGEPHAEVEALRNLRDGIRAGDTLYVTLEPCNHFGRTPPCTEAILRSGIARVVVGATDPNPSVVGGGCRFLTENGVEVVSGILESECRRLIEVFTKFSLTGRPFVAAKSALTLDGWTATSTGNSRWITGETARQFVHRLREVMDAVMIGVGTVLADDPSLTVRLRTGKGKVPLRVVLDTHLRTNPGARLLRDADKESTLLVVGETVPADRLKWFQEQGVRLLVCPEKDGGIDLDAVMAKLGAISVTSVLLEGGATLMGAMIRKRLIDKFYIFEAPKILGGGDGIPMAGGPGPVSIDQCIRFRDVRIRKFGEDLLIEGYPEYSKE